MRDCVEGDYRPKLRFLLLAVILLLTAVVVFNCGDDKGTDSNNNNNGSNVVGPEGGTVSDGDGSSVVIPAGALDADITVSVKTISEIDDLPDSLLSYGLGLYGAIELGPDGQQFNTPVTITFPIDTQLTAGDSLPLFSWVPEDSCWQCEGVFAEVQAGGMSVSAEVTHFSHHTVWGSVGGGGLFDGFAWEKGPEAAFYEFVDLYDTWQDSKIVEGGESDGCCMSVVKRKFYFEYH
nr:hypothetical protein [candidate division Zixibacteria bacterium]